MRVVLSSCSLFALLLVSGCAGCTSTVDSDDEARLAYLGLDRAVDRALQLGFDGFNAASNANIPVQAGDAEESGEMIVSGQVDQGVSANKNMRLDVALLEYSDGPIDDPETKDVEEELVIVYETAEESPLYLELQLQDIPTGTLTGTFSGTTLTDGDIAGEISLDLTVAADLEPGSDGEEVQRAAGSTRITGTVTSDAGDYDVEVTY